MSHTSEDDQSSPRILVRFITNAEMSCWQNCLLQGLFLLLYAPFKYVSIPFFNYARYLILRLFCKKIQSTYIAEGVTFAFPWRIEIASRSSLNQGVIIDGSGGVKIGHGVRIAPYVCINTADHNFSDPEIFIYQQGFKVAPVTIEDDVWIGAATQINKGVTIGKGAVIGSGSVVTRDIPPYSIAVGVPCRVVGARVIGGAKSPGQIESE